MHFLSTLKPLIVLSNYLKAQETQEAPHEVEEVVSRDSVDVLHEENCKIVCEKLHK